MHLSFLFALLAAVYLFDSFDLFDLPHLPPLSPLSRYRTGLLAVFAAVCGCAAVDVPVLPHDVPTAWHASQNPQNSTASILAPAPDLRTWWTLLDDPLLNHLVDQALAQNLDVAQARSRLRQARLLFGQATAQYLPALTASSRTVQSVSASDSYFQASLDAVWELGLFGARESAQRAGQAHWDSAASAAQAAQVSTVAEVVRSYVDLRAAQQQWAVLERMLALDQRALALLEVQQRLQLGSPDALRQARLRVLHTQAQMGQPREMAAHAAQGLALLLGRAAPDSAWMQPPAITTTSATTSAVISTATATSTPPLPHQPTFKAFTLSQVPADLLRYQPAVRSAEADVLGAAAELGSAQAALYPRLVLGASWLYSLNVTQNRPRTANHSIPALGPLLDIPLLDWGRRKAIANAQQEALNAAVLAYRQAVLTAVAQTESALTSLEQAGVSNQHLQAAQTLLEQDVQAQATLARLGLASTLEHIAAQRSALETALEHAAAQARQTLAVVALYKSLGGAPLLLEIDATTTPSSSPTTTPAAIGQPVAHAALP